MADRKQYDPKMHTTEHILNQTMVRLFDCGRSFSAHIEKKKSKCDYHFNRDLTEQEVADIETRVNNVIDSHADVYEEFYDLQTAEQKFNLSKLPEGAGENIRVIKIGDYDACPCIGEHVSNTSELGTFKIISTSFSDDVLRLRFKLLAD